LERIAHNDFNIVAKRFIKPDTNDDINLFSIKALITDQGLNKASLLCIMPVHRPKIGRDNKKWPTATPIPDGE